MKFRKILQFIVAAAACVTFAAVGTIFASAEQRFVDAPKADATEFTYTAEAQTYKLTPNSLYTITVSGTGATADTTTGEVKATNAGTYTITVSLFDKTTTAWSDTTTADKTYDFKIAKAKPVIPEPKLAFSELYYGEKETACGIQNGWQLPNSAALLTSIGANNIDVTLVVDSDNYDYTTGLPTGYTFDEAHSTLTTTITIKVKKAKPEVKIDTSVYTAKSNDTITVTASAVNPYNTSMAPTFTTFVKVGDGAETELTSTAYTVPDNLADKTKITFIARVEESAEYEAASAETFVVIGDGSCTHPNVSAFIGEWLSDDSYHWKICPDCGAQVYKDEHNNSASGATCSSGAVCGKCGKIHGAFDRTRHSSFEYKKVDSEYHIKCCKNCRYEDSSSKKAHVFNSDSICARCGYEKSGEQFIITATTEGETLTYGTDYTYPKSTGVLKILSQKAITIKNADGVTTATDRIEVASGVSANITLAGVNIDVSGIENAAAFKIADGSSGNVTITLADGSTNVLTSGKYCAGLQKSGYNGSLEIKGGTLGTGSLTATGGWGAAGIGGGQFGAGLNIKISGGTVIAKGNISGAGIGGGRNSEGSNIEISGGTVTATSEDGGAGIGGCFRTVNSNIKISGGTVIAKGGYFCAGIGGGERGAGTNIEISGNAIVEATGGTCGAGIGGGREKNGTDIKISGGTVTATGGTGGAGIGGGAYYTGGTSSNITITGGSVKATGKANVSGEYTAADIGDGVTTSSDGTAVTPTNGTANVYLLELDSVTTSLKIDGKDYPINHGTDGKVYVYLTEGKHTIEKDGVAETNTYAANPKDSNKLIVIGSELTITGTDLVYGTDYTYPKSTGVLTILSDKAVTIKNADPTKATTDTILVGHNISANITLNGVNIDVSGTINKAAFEIYKNSTANVKITLADDSTNTLKSGMNCAGLQKNSVYIDETRSKLTITGTGSLTAIGGNSGAGIGSSFNKSVANITIENGTIIATGGNSGAGIGGGNYGSCSYITINGGTVIATGDSSGAGIGAGYGCSSSYITIRGGTVTAKGGDSGSGIGGSESTGENSKNIVITGGSVKAVAGGNANAIGGGSGCDPVIPTLADNTTPVYLLEIKNPNSGDITINNVTYPIKHVYYENGVEKSEDKIYVYLPAKTATDPNVITVGDKTTKCYYNTNKWITVIEKPTEPTITDFTYNGSEQTYALAESEYYTISGNKKTNVGDYTVTVTLIENVVWNDGTSAPLTFNFKIKKARPVIDTPTASGITYGQSLSESTLTNGWSWDDGTVVPSAGWSQHYAVKTVTDDDNYDYDNSYANIIYNSNTHTIKYFTAINVNRATPVLTLTVNSGAAMPGSKVTLGVSVDNVVMSNLPSYSATYRVDSGAEEGFVNEFVIPADTPEGAVITITVETTKDLNYNQVTKTASFTVNACDHALLSENWLFTPTTHYKKCEHCQKAVNEANHTYNNDGYCTVCGYFEGAAIVTTTAATTTTTEATTTTTAPVTYPIYTGYRPNVVTTTTTAAVTTTTTTTTANTDTTTTPTNDNEPFIVGEDGKIGWEAIEDQIDNSADGETITIDMNGTTKLPETILEAIMGRDITIILEMENGFAWTINGNDVTDPSTIDMEVITGSSIKAKVVNALTGECSYVEITLKHNGEFGFTATLTVKLGKENKGFFANLYYYDDNGDFELISSGKIGKSGKADLKFTHASEYVIVIDDYDHMTESDVEADTEVKADEKPAETPNDVVIEVPLDDDGNPITGVAISFSAVILAGAVVIATKKRK